MVYGELSQIYLTLLDQIDTHVSRLEAQDIVYPDPSVGQQQSEFVSGGLSPVNFAESSTAGDDIQFCFLLYKTFYSKKFASHENTN